MTLSLLRYLVISIAALNISQVNAEWMHTSEDIMGTNIVVDIWHIDKTVSQNCTQQVFQDMNRIEQLLSPYIAASELAIVNEQAATREVKISNEFFILVKKSLHMSDISKGAFDITFASIGHMYDYRNKQRPSEQSIKQHLSAINYKHIILNEQKQSIRFTRPGVRIDLGGIAKGYAVDNAIAILKKCGIENGLVSAGGDSKIIGTRNGRPWMMGIRHPRNRKAVMVTLPLSNTAISTSGDYERFFIEDGKRYHHILRPATGESVSETWSVTVIAEDAVLTDALSTTLFVMEIKDALALIEQYKNVDVIIVDAKGKMHYSSGLMPPDQIH